MRHIPDDELHAYLDQALSRSQCIEIETHLARCAQCGESRDTIAALRDRTTALLASTTPRRSAGPSLPTLLARAEAKRRHSWRRSAMLAASFGGAILAGWGMRAVFDPHEDTPGARPLVQAEPSPTTLPTSSPAARDPAPSSVRPVINRASTSLSDTPVRLAADGGPEVEAVELPLAHQPVVLILDEGWRAADRGDAEGSAEGMLPVFPGLPVTDVQVREIGPDERPLVIVTQPHESGTVLYTVEGPAERVAEIVAAQLAAAPAGFGSSNPSRSPPDYIETPSGFRRTHRVLAVLGSLPFDTLNAIAHQVTIRH